MEIRDSKCPICKGTGFDKGKICVCISGKDTFNKDGLEFLKGMFGIKDKK